MAPLIGLLAPLLGTVLDRVLPDTVERDKVEAELAATLLQHSARIEETAAEVVVAEAKGES